jgi:hypothetical protein
MFSMTGYFFAGSNVVGLTIPRLEAAEGLSHARGEDGAEGGAVHAAVRGLAARGFAVSAASKGL